MRLVSKRCSASGQFSFTFVSRIIDEVLNCLIMSSPLMLFVEYRKTMISAVKIFPSRMFHGFL